MRKVSRVAFALIALVIVVAVAVIAYSQSRGRSQLAATTNVQIEDSRAEASRWVERLGGQVLNVEGTDDASKQAMADASERFNAATGQLETAQTPVQAKLAKETALEGLYYVRAARLAMGMDPGPDLPKTEGQDKAGAVTEDRTIDFEGRQLTASANPSDRTPNYYPGGVIAGRPVPAGWYSEPWWAGALRTGMWTMASMAMFSMMFSGMSGIGQSVVDAGSGLGDMGGDGGGLFGDGGLFGGDGEGFFDGFDF